MERQRLENEISLEDNEASTCEHEGVKTNPEPELDAESSKATSAPIAIVQAEGAKGVPLFDASKMGFNERAWNDPPPLLMSMSPGTVASAKGRKLTSRVAFPLDSSKYPSANSGASSLPLNPNAPPPSGGFVNLSTTPPK